MKKAKKKKKKEAKKKQRKKTHESWLLYVTLHHEMSRNVPDGHFHVLYFLKVNFMLFTMVKSIFKSEYKWPNYAFLNIVVRHLALLRKLALNVEDFCVKTIGWGYKIMFWTIKYGKVGYFHVTD